MFLWPMRYEGGAEGGVPFAYFRGWRQPDLFVSALIFADGVLVRR